MQKHKNICSKYGILTYFKGMENFKNIHSTLPITKKKYAEILLCYRRLFVKGVVVIGGEISLYLCPFKVTHALLSAYVLYVHTSLITCTFLADYCECEII